MTTMRTVDGMRSDGMRLYPVDIDVRVTVDSVGKSLSLCDGEVMLLVPVEPIADLVDVREVDA